MSATYTPGSGFKLDSLRFRLPDTDTANPVFTDEEIVYILSENDDDEDAAYGALASEMGKRLSLRPDDIDQGGVKVSFTEGRKAFLAASARIGGGLSSHVPSRGTYEE